MNKTVVVSFYLANFLLIFFHDSTGGLGKISLIFILVLYFFLFKAQVLYAFLLCIVVISNPGGMFSGSPFGWQMKFFYVQDIFFYLGFLCLLSPNLVKKRIDGALKKLLPAVWLFTFYQIFISLIYKQNITSLFSAFKHLEELKLFIFGVYMLFPAYFIIKNDFKIFFKNIVFLALIYTTVFLVSVFTDMSIVSYTTAERMGIVGIQRIMIRSNEIFYIIIYLALLAYLSSKDHKYPILYITGLLAIVIPIVGMFRLQLFYTIMTIVIAVIFMSKSEYVPISRYFSITFLIIFSIVIAVIVFPVMFEGLMTTFFKTWQEFQGNAPKGASQTRSIIELPLHLKLIRQSPFTGVGFRKEWWMNFLSRNDWGLSDIPLTSTLAMYGFIGMAIYYYRFINIFQGVDKILKFIRANYQSLKAVFNEEIIYIYVLSAYFVIMVTFRLFYIGWELTLDRLQPEFGVFIGIFYGLKDNLLQFKREKE